MATILTEGKIDRFRGRMNTSPDERITRSFLQDLAETYKNINPSLIESDTFLLKLTDLTIEARKKLFPPGHNYPADVEDLYNEIHTNAVFIQLQKKAGKVDKSIIRDIINVGMSLSKLASYVKVLAPLFLALQKPMLN